MDTKQTVPERLAYWLGPYRKTLTALVTGLGGWGAQVIASDVNHIVASEWLSLYTVVGVALGVYAVNNEPDPAHTLQAIELGRTLAAATTQKASRSSR